MEESLLRIARREDLGDVRIAGANNGRNLGKDRLELVMLKPNLEAVPTDRLAIVGINALLRRPDPENDCPVIVRREIH